MLEHKHILAVDDSSSIRSFLASKLQSESTTVVTAENGQSTIQALKDNAPFDLIVLDLLLPDTDGISLLKQIRETNKTTTIVILTGTGGIRSATEAVQSGADGYISKQALSPFDDHQEFFLTLEQAIEHRAGLIAQKELERHRQQVQRAKSLQRMAGSIAHHQNNNLQTILGNLSLAMDCFSMNDQMRETLEEIQTAAQQSAKLSKLMLLYVGQGLHRNKEINLSELAQTVAQTLQVPERISITTHLSTDPPSFMGAPGQMTQLIKNMAMNAIESIGNASGNVVIKTEPVTTESFTVSDETLPAGEYMVLEISDDGCGMDNAMKNQIFDPFFTTHFFGRGLGLAAASGIARAHNGAIAVKSKPGKGSTFTAYFPTH